MNQFYSEIEILTIFERWVDISGQIHINLKNIKISIIPEGNMVLTTNLHEKLILT